MKRVLVILMLFISLVIGFLYFMFWNVPPKSVNPAQKPQVNSQNNDRQELIAQLANLHGRAAGSNYEKKAATLLAKEFVSLDLEPLPNKKNYYFQTFMVPKRESYYLNNRLRFKGVGKHLNPSQNVLGYLPGNTNKVIIFTAHYDGQGINDKQVYASANDNLSGIYVLLNIAHGLQKRPNRNLSYLFVAFGAEEMGLYGSEYFVNNLPLEKDKIIGVLNFDTVSTEGEKMTIEAFDANSVVKNVEQALINYNFSVHVDLSKRRTSDHYHFSTAGFSALTVAAYDWLDLNHTPQDTYDRLNFPLLDQLSSSIIDMTLTIDELTS